MDGRRHILPSALSLLLTVALLLSASDAALLVHFAVTHHDGDGDSAPASPLRDHEHHCQAWTAHTSWSAVDLPAPGILDRLALVERVAERPEHPLRLVDRYTSPPRGPPRRGA